MLKYKTQVYMELFAKNESYLFFEKLTNGIKEEINCMSDETIQNTDIDELINCYIENKKIQPITLFLDNLNPVLSEEKLKRFTNYYRTDNEFIYLDGYKITYSIQFDGDNRLFDLEPSTRIMQRFHVQFIEKSTDTKYGIITYVLEFTKQEMEGKDTPDFVKNQFDSSFQNIKLMIDYINKDVQQYNTSIQYVIQKAFEARKKKADDFVKLSNNLAIPLKINPYAPNTTPLLLKKNIVRKPEMPKVKQIENDYAISTNDYDNIKRIISMAGYSMEKTARTFNKFAEEELRDIFIAFLNTHYLGMATGETFSKRGKTDIHIQFDNKAAFIAECKIWSGEKNLQEAINQLFSYITWRDVKTSILIFNKEIKDFLKLLEKVRSFLEKNELCQKKIAANKNEWLCEFRKSKESSELITVQIIIFDLYITERKGENK